MEFLFRTVWSTRSADCFEEIANSHSQEGTQFVLRRIINLTFRSLSKQSLLSKQCLPSGTTSADKNSDHPSRMAFVFCKFISSKKYQNYSLSSLSCVLHCVMKRLSCLLCNKAHVMKKNLYQTPKALPNAPRPP